MGIRIITGVIDVKGHPQPGSVEITYNPLAVVATDRADVFELQAFGDTGYFANRPSVLMSVNNLSIEDLIDPSGNLHNRIYRLRTSYTTDPENIFQRVIYHRATMRWEYGPTGGEWCQGRVDKISFMIAGDAVPLEETPLQDLPPEPFGFQVISGYIYLTIEKHHCLSGKHAITHGIKSQEDLTRSVDHLVQGLEACRKRVEEELGRQKAVRKPKK